ncbi:MAG: hypothetical protein ACRC8S_05310 [Fimbriiglobus sp.]
MNRRRAICVGCVATAGVVAAGGWWAWDLACQIGVSGTCVSDTLSVVAQNLRGHVEKHGRLPEAAELLAVGAGGRKEWLFCRRARLPFQWDLRVAGMPVSGVGRRAILWCPPGGHGRYVGAVILDMGEVKAVTLQIAELRKLVPTSDGV